MKYTFYPTAPRIFLDEALQNPSQAKWVVICRQGYTALPEELRKCKKLQLLEAYDNQLTQLPGWLSELKDLKGLWLNENNLTSLPDNICQLSGLKNLYLGKNNLTMLPEKIGKLKDLILIALENNTALKQLPDSFWDLKNLKELDISNTSIENIDERIANLKNLEVLKFEALAIKTLPHAICKLKNLKSLHLNNSKIEALPEELFKLPYLEMIDLRKTPIDQDEALKQRYQQLAPHIHFEWKKVINEANFKEKHGEIIIPIQNLPKFKDLHLHKGIGSDGSCIILLTDITSFKKWTGIAQRPGEKYCEYEELCEKFENEYTEPNVRITPTFKNSLVWRDGEFNIDVYFSADKKDILLLDKRLEVDQDYFHSQQEVDALFNKIMQISIEKEDKSYIYTLEGDTLVVLISFISYQNIEESMPVDSLEKYMQENLTSQNIIRLYDQTNSDSGMALKVLPGEYYFYKGYEDKYYLNWCRLKKK